MKIAFSKQWNKSVQPRKQRKYRANAPLHIKQKFVASHLSKDLQKRYSKRSIIVKKGDTVKIMRGQFKSKTGKVDVVNIKKTKVLINGIELVKKDGTKKQYAVHPSNIQITELNTDDKKRQQSLKRGKENVKTS